MKFLVLILSLLLCIATTKASTFTISGKVIEEETQQPVPGVYLSIGKESAQTNKEGTYTISNVTEGTYTLQVMPYMMYERQQIELNITKDTIVNIVLKQRVTAMEQVVVTGTRTEKKLSEAPVQTTVIKSADIKMAGATSAMETLLDNIPGIVSTPNAMGNNLRIRGLNSRYILFLVDGERMVSEGAGGNINLDQIDVNTIERGEIINGAASALYGSNAVGAVINIITKKTSHKVEAEANASYENYNTWRSRVSVGTRLKNFSARASGFRNSSDGYGGDGTGPYAAKYEDYGADLKLEYTPIKQLKFTANGRYFQHESFNIENSFNTTHPLTHTITVGGSMQHTTLKKRNNLLVSVNYTNYIDADYFEKLYESKIGSTASYLSTRVVNTFKMNEKLELVGGLEQNHEENYSTTTLGTEATTKTLDDYNAFAQAQYTPFKKFDIVEGERYTYNTKYNSAFTPKLSLMYGYKGFTFRGGIGTAFRAPSIKELYYDFDHQGMFWIYGNPDLKAEKGLYNSLSVEYVKKYFYVSVGGYWNDINEKINQYTVVNEQGALEYHYQNVSSATLRGVDVNLSYILLRKFVLKGSYSFCDAVNNATGLQLSSNVKHSSTLSATWNGKIATSPFSLQVSGRITSPQLYQYINDNGDGTTSTVTEQSKVYNIWKITLVKPFRIKHHTFELTLKCDNIFNFEDSSFINPGRQYLIGVRYAFK